MGEIHPSITLLPSSGNELPVESKFFTEFKTKIAAIFSDIMLSFKILVKMAFIKFYRTFLGLLR